LHILKRPGTKKNSQKGLKNQPKGNKNKKEGTWMRRKDGGKGLGREERIENRQKREGRGEGGEK
jgi:hypothetical protein